MLSSPAGLRRPSSLQPTKLPEKMEAICDLLSEGMQASVSLPTVQLAGRAPDLICASCSALRRPRVTGVPKVVTFSGAATRPAGIAPVKAPAFFRIAGSSSDTPMSATREAVRAAVTGFGWNTSGNCTPLPVNLLMPLPEPPLLFLMMATLALLNEPAKAGLGWQTTANWLVSVPTSL